MTNDPTICAAISGFGTILALLAATLGAMAIAGIFKDRDKDRIDDRLEGEG